MLAEPKTTPHSTTVPSSSGTRQYTSTNSGHHRTLNQEVKLAKVRRTRHAAYKKPKRYCVPFNIDEYDPNDIIFDRNGIICRLSYRPPRPAPVPEVKEEEDIKPTICRICGHIHNA